MKSLMSGLLLLATIALNAQSQLFKESDPQIIYAMYVESVEPLHRAFENSLTIVHKPHFNGDDLIDLYRDCRHELETFHKDRLHRDAYVAADTYLKEVDTIVKQVAPILDQIEEAQDDAIGGLIDQMQAITIQEKPIVDAYRKSMMKVIELFHESFETWLTDEVIYFSRLAAVDRNKLYDSGFGVRGLVAVKRRFYTAKYFVVDMKKDVTESRVRTIKASFDDLSTLPEYMVRNTKDFVAQVEEPLLRYNYEKSEEDGKIIYSKGANTTFDFTVKEVHVRVISEESNTVSIKFVY